MLKFLGPVMIKDFNEIDTLASQIKPLRLAALAADEEEFLRTIKVAYENHYIEPCIIGDLAKIQKTAELIDFNISSIEIIHETDPQSIADKGIDMLFTGKTDIPIKGHIPTSFIYRSIIQHEKALGEKTTISVNTIWDIAGMNHLVSITDTGVSIAPSYETKKNIITDAVRLMNLFGYEKPRVLILSAYTGLTRMLDSYSEARTLQEEAAQGNFGNCEIVEETSLAGIFVDKGSRLDDLEKLDLGSIPHVIVVPHLDAGNILSKLDFVLNITRRSVVLTSHGPVIIPSRSDTHDLIVGEIALGVVIAHLLKGTQQ